MARSARHMRCDEGFTLVELLVTVLVIGILVTIAMPVFYATRATAEKRSCFANQRTIEGAVSTWESLNSSNVIPTVAGLVDAANPIVVNHIVGVPPRCPAAPRPVNRANPTAAEGAYSLDTSGNIVPCTFGTIGSHGRYR